MKLIDIANQIDKSQKNEDFVSISDIAYQEFDIKIDWIEQVRLKCYWVGNWCCTDTFVGYRMYFFDDIPVAFSIQNGRKCQENFKWFSNKLALKVREYIVSLLVKKEDETPTFDICDINEDIGESYKINFNTAILNPENACLNSKPVKILERILEVPDYGIDRKLKVLLDNGCETIVNVRDLDFKFHLNNDVFTKL